MRNFGLKGGGGSSARKDSFSSSEMERNFSDEGLSLPKVDSQMQTDPRLGCKEFASQTEISHNGKTFLSIISATNTTPIGITSKSRLQSSLD